MSAHISNIRQEFDPEIIAIVDYVMNYHVRSEVAYNTARNCLIDTLGCGLEALQYPACRKLLGPIVPGTIVPNGAKFQVHNSNSTQCRLPSTLAL